MPVFYRLVPAGRYTCFMTIGITVLDHAEVHGSGVMRRFTLLTLCEEVGDESTGS